MRDIGRAGGCAVFGQKLLTTQRGVGRCAYKSSIMKWTKALKETSKKNPKTKNKSLKPNAASHNNASWYTGTDGFLEHSS